MDLQIHTNCVMRSIYERCRYSSRQLLKSIVVMKLALLLITINLQVSAAAYAQNISLNFKNAQLRDVLQSIRKQSGYSFVIDGNDLRNANPVTITLKSSSIETTLHSLFENQPFTYKVEGKLIMIKPKKTEKKIEISVSMALTTLRGFVRDKDGRPLSGVTILVKGTNLGSTTDNSGKFSISNAPESGSLIVRMIGKESREISYKTANIPEIVLHDSQAESLKEIQIIAYGEVEKKFSTSNIGSVSGDIISKQPVNNPLLALSGRTPGLFIQQFSGLNTGAVNVTVQGRNSLTKGNIPFYVIDGVPFAPNSIGSGVMGSIGTGATSNLNFLNPADIASVEILKDADATAIYGSRAANGAILITTKKGKAGQRKVDLNMQTGWSKVARRINLLNTQEYLGLRNEAMRSRRIH